MKKKIKADSVDFKQDAKEAWSKIKELKEHAGKTWPALELLGDSEQLMAVDAFHDALDQILKKSKS